MADAKIIKNAVFWKRFEMLPQQLQIELGKQLAIEAEDMALALRRAAPVSPELEKHPGQLRDSVHDYANPVRPLSYKIIADARDDHGNFIAPHVEYGHLAVNGTHVPAVPWFWPTYRAREKAMRRRLMNTAKMTIKSLFPDVQNGN